MVAGADLRVPFDALAAPFGVEATVDPDGTPIETTAIWIDAATIASPIGQEFQGIGPHRVLALSVDEVSAIPNGTVILAPERRGDVATRWRKESDVGIDADLRKVLVVPAPDEET